VASKVEIVNKALSYLGANPITNITDNTTEAKIANRVYSTSLKTTLTDCNWHFALKREDLNQSTTEMDWYRDDMQYVFVLPSDVLKITDVSDRKAIWKIIGDFLVCNSSTIGIEYIYDITDTSKFTPTFIDTFADRLAADMAFFITNDTKLAQAMLEKYETVSLSKAMAINSQESGTPQAVDDSLWVDSKYGYISGTQRGGSRA
jgi:hypothetical protein